MAVFGAYTDLARQLDTVPLFTAAIDYLRRCFAKGSAENSRLAALAEGETYRAELAGGAHAIEQVYLTRPRAACCYESHRLYIDVQAVIEGEEFIEVASLDRLHVTQPYVAERDVVKYADFEFGSRLRLGPGDIAVLFPPDGHLPCLATGPTPLLVRKTVVKIPVALPLAPPPPAVAVPGV
jgi:biofilm protein TabA